MQRLLILLAAVIGMNSPLAAEPKTATTSAKQLIEGIKKQLSQGKYRPAILAMETLYGMKPQPVVLFNIAVAKDKLDLGCVDRIAAYVRFFKHCIGCQSESAGRERIETVYKDCHYGNLSVIAHPSDAMVLVDGTMMGQGPVNAKVAPGPHKIKIRNPSGETVREVVMPRSGHQSITLFIVPEAVSNALSVSGGKDEGLPEGIATETQLSTGTAGWIQYSVIGGGTVLSGIGVSLLFAGNNTLTDAKKRSRDRAQPITLGQYRKDEALGIERQERGAILIALGLTTAVSGIIWWLSEADNLSVTERNVPMDDGLKLGVTSRALYLGGTF
jgi:hypothetical protein